MKTNLPTEAAPTENLHHHPMVTIDSPLRENDLQIGMKTDMLHLLLIDSETLFQTGHQIVAWKEPLNAMLTGE